MLWEIRRIYGDDNDYTLPRLFASLWEPLAFRLSSEAVEFQCTDGGAVVAGTKGLVYLVFFTAVFGSRRGA